MAKTTTCCICMWKLSFLKHGNTHLISELYYKIGRWFIFRKIIMFSVPLESGPGLFFKGSFTHIRKIKFLLLCSHYFPHPTISLYSGLSNHLIWKWQLPDILKAKSTFSNIWFPTATPFNAGNCSTLGNQSIHPVAYFLQIILKKRTQNPYFTFTATGALFQVRLKETVTTEIGRIS